jgi:hypothetical protein
MNLLKPRILKGFPLKAQGCEGGKSSLDRATLGLRRRTSTTLKGLRPIRAARRFVERAGVRGTNAPASQVLSPTRDRDATSRRFMERRVFGIWLLELLWNLELGIWSFPRVLTDRIARRRDEISFAKEKSC